MGLIKYDVDYFKDKVNDRYDPYIFHGFVCPITWWVRSLNQSNGYSDMSCQSDRSAQEITLKQEDAEIKPAPLPDPVKPLDDNTVFTLKSQADGNGNKIVDSQGRPLLNWIKCKKIGEQ